MRIPPWLFIVSIVLVVGLTAVGALLAFSIARQVAVDLGAQGIQFTAFQVGESVPTPTPISVAIITTPQSAATSSASNAQAVSTVTLDPAAEYAWTDPRRFTLLLLGIDQRSGVEEQGPFRTDTMIVISVDPVRKSAGVLNIPRDLWVSIPGFTQNRINTANAIGDANGYPGGGPALAAETVRQVLGIPIDHYLLVNFDVFTAVVSIIAPNGVEVCPPAAIDDPDYPDAGYGTIAVRFEAGCQTLQAERLLQYARTRASQGADFDRARRQQEVLNALREQVLSVGGIANFIGQAPALWEELSGSFRTNMSLSEILRLGALMSEIPRENIRFGVIDNLYVNLATTTSGEQVLLLKTNATRLLLQQIFNPEEDLSLSDLRARAEAENATIMIFNNTNQAGLASQTRDWLTGRGVAVLDVGNVAEASNANTVINVYTGKVWTARYLAALMRLPVDRVQPGADGLTDKDIAVLVGPDISGVLSSP